MQSDRGDGGTIALSKKSLGGINILPLVGVLAALAALGLPAAAAAGELAVVVGANGKIVFSESNYGNLDIFAANPDGSGRVNLTPDSYLDDRSSSWSPDGSRVAYSNEDGNILGVNVDSAGAAINLTNGTGVFGNSPSWSPDGTMIAFAGWLDGAFGIMMMDAADGSNLRRLVTRIHDKAPPCVELAWPRQGAGRRHVGGRDACVGRAFDDGLYAA